MALILRLWLSVAICEQLIVLTFGYFSRCSVAVGIDTKYYCSGVVVGEAVDFIPSNATDIEFEATKQKHVTLSFKSYFPVLNSLKFSNGELETIGSSSLQQLNALEYLGFPNNKLWRLERDSLLGLVNLEILELQGNQFALLKDVVEALFSVGNLTYLDLSDNLFESISFEEAEELANLTVGKLKLNGCRINQVDPFILSNWNIDELYISNNPADEKCLRNISLGLGNSSVRKVEMHKLSWLAFSFGETPLLPLYHSKVEKLSIGENEFAFKMTFRSFLFLNDLEIVKSVIHDIDMDELLSLPNLEHLKMIDNRINRISYWNKLAERGKGSVLKTLELTRNRSPIPEVPFIPKDMFTSLPNLSKLILFKTPFGNTITDQTFAGLRMLEKLQVDYCSIEEVENGAFINLDSLELLTLEGNKLRSLRKEMFIGLHNLTLLDLSSNFLRLTNESSPFSVLTGLEILVLSDNEITHLKPSYFANLTKLHGIDLGNNMIVPWDTRVIPEGTSVSTMILHSNKLNVITETMLQEFSGLQSIDLAANSFDCWNCSMLTFRKWIASTNVTLVDLEKDSKYVCQYPQSLKGKSIMTAKLEREHCGEELGKAILLAIVFSCTIVALVFLGIASYRLRWHFRYCCYLLRSHVKRFKETRDSFPYEYDAFVSYDPTDYIWVRNHLLATLETDSHRIRLCLVDRDCVAGTDVTEEIFEAIQKCRKMLLVLSDSYVKNQWCMFDLHMAQHSFFEEKRDSLILIQLQPIEKELVSANLAYLITTRTYIMWIEHPIGQRMFWKRLLAALAKPDTLRMSHIV